MRQAATEGATMQKVNPAKVEAFSINDFDAEDGLTVGRRNAVSPAAAHRISGARASAGIAANASISVREVHAPFFGRGCRVGILIPAAALSWEASGETPPRRKHRDAIRGGRRSSFEIRRRIGRSQSTGSEYLPAVCRHQKLKGFALRRA